MDDSNPTNKPLIELISRTFPNTEILQIQDIGDGRGIFSTVSQVHLANASVPSVVVKAPFGGDNSVAAKRSGAYGREVFAYESAIPSLGIRTAKCFAISEFEGEPWFVLEDLTNLAPVDQIAGINQSQVLNTIETALWPLHQSAIPAGLTDISPAGPGSFDPDRLARSFAELKTQSRLDPLVLAAFGQILERREELIEQFQSLGSTDLCHGDPRADNLFIDESSSSAVLVDWQQLSASFGEADLSWLVGTSVPSTVGARPQTEAAALELYASLSGNSAESCMTRYRTGYVKPGLAVLLLAQRETANARARQIVQLSLERIGNALVDLKIGQLG